MPLGLHAWANEGDREALIDWGLGVGGQVGGQVGM